MSRAVFRVHDRGGVSLRIRFAGATTSRGSRYVVSELGGSRWVSVPFRHDLIGSERRADAVRAWTVRFDVGTCATWVIGGTGSGEWVAVCVPGCDVVARVGGAE